MKKYFLIFFTLVMLLFFQSKSSAQISPCIILSAETISPSPQSGGHNYHGVKLTLSQTYDQDIEISGYIYGNEEGYNTDHPYKLIISSGNLTAETSATFLQTSPTSGAEITFQDIAPVFVTSNGITYRTSGECSEFENEIVDLSVHFGDSVEIAGAVTDSLLNGLSESTQNGFWTYLAANGVAATATQYSMSQADVSFIKTTYENTWASFWAIVQSTYGPVDSITLEQFEAIVNKSDPVIEFSRAAPEDLGMIGLSCEEAARICGNSANSDLNSSEILCRPMGNSTTFTSFLLSLGGVIPCMINAKNRWIRAHYACAITYSGCPGRLY